MQAIMLYSVTGVQCKPLFLVSNRCAMQTIICYSVTGVQCKQVPAAVPADNEGPVQEMDADGEEQHGWQHHGVLLTPGRTQRLSLSRLGKGGCGLRVSNLAWQWSWHTGVCVYVCVYVCVCLCASVCLFV